VIDINTEGDTKFWYFSSRCPLSKYWIK